MEAIETWLARQQQLHSSELRPAVTLSYAQSLDGSLAARRGQPLAISGAESMALTHRLRAAHEAILVGIGTLLADDPRLTVRHAGGRSPQPVLLDSWLRCPPTARLLHEPRPHPVLIACREEYAGAGSHAARAAALTAAGAELLYLPPGESGGISLPALLRSLADRGVRSLMVEGGAKVITAFITQGLADVLILTIAPLFVGGVAAVEQPLEAPWPRLLEPHYTPVGPDLVVWGRLSTAGQ